MVELADRGGQVERTTWLEPDHYQSARYTYFTFVIRASIGSNSHRGRVRVPDHDGRGTIGRYGALTFG